MAVVGTASRGLVVYQLENTPSEFKVRILQVHLSHAELVTIKPCFTITTGPVMSNSARPAPPSQKKKEKEKKQKKRFPPDHVFLPNMVSLLKASHHQNSELYFKHTGLLRCNVWVQHVGLLRCNVWAS